MNPAEPPSDDPPVSTETVAPETAESQPRGIARTIRQVVRSELRVFSGPLPPPEILVQYNEVFPGCGKAVFEMAQKEQQHRHAREDRETEADIKLASRGQIIGGALAMVAVLGAI